MLKMGADHASINELVEQVFAHAICHACKVYAKSNAGLSF
jgi:hypothetical protein